MGNLSEPDADELLDIGIEPDQELVQRERVGNMYRTQAIHHIAKIFGGPIILDSKTGKTYRNIEIVKDDGSVLSLMLFGVTQIVYCDMPIVKSTTLSSELRLERASP